MPVIGESTMVSTSGWSNRKKLWYQQDALEVARYLRTDPTRGLETDEAVRRLQEAGPNETTQQRSKGRWSVLRRQFTSLMVIILLIAGTVSVAIGDIPDALAILAIVILNALVGFRQEYRAERALTALKRLSRPTVRVRRDGVVREISSTDLVPGDLVLLEAGNMAPADGRLIEAVNLRTQESALTGESEPVDKDAAMVCDGELSLGDRRNMVYAGTVVTYGRGLAVITETGERTELGRIAAMIQSAGEDLTRLQRKLDDISRRLAVAALALVGIVFVTGLWRGTDLKRMFLTAVSMAVAAVPEGLPAVVTISLALGSQRMLKRHALIRRLSAVETLGSVTVICTDKTGTLTENRMEVAAASIGSKEWDLPADAIVNNHGLLLLLAGGALCNDARNGPAPRPGEEPGWIGDPLEIALAQAASRAGLEKKELDRLFVRVAELPFDSERKRMTTVHRKPGTGLHHAVADLLRTNAPYVAFTKGAVDSMIELCGFVWTHKGAESLSQSERLEIRLCNDRLAGQGMRVLGIAYRVFESADKEQAMLERDLTFVGMVGLADPPRAEARKAVELCGAAGIRPIMITGDHPLTARHIARQVGISNGARVVMGKDLDGFSQKELQSAVADVSVFARVTAEHKLKIVTALQQRGEVVAMTGDGINDAPALKQADIGIAMGRAGTDVAREAASIVLQDDNFASIVAAVEEGRTIYDNVRKVIRYLVASNSGEICVMLLAPLAGMPLPLLPVQILWVNLVTDGLPALALAREPAEHDAMRRPPHSPKHPLLSDRMGWWIFSKGCLLGSIALAGGYIFWLRGSANWQTIVFTILTLSQLLLALAVRSERQSFFTQGIFSNRPLMGAVGVTFLLQLLIVYMPICQTIFHTMTLTPGQLIACLTLSTAVFWAAELEKYRIRRSRQAR